MRRAIAVVLLAVFCASVPVQATAARVEAHSTDAPQRPIGPLTSGQIVAMIHAQWGPEHGPRAVRIAQCESDLRPHVTHRNRNGTIDYGLFQINSGGTLQSLGITAVQALDPATNIRAAHLLWRRRGWQPWVCSRIRRH